MSSAEKKEYIEREAAKNAILEYIYGHTMSKFPSKELCCASKKGAEGAMYELDYVPAADVAPVVRCKDCKYIKTLVDIFGEPHLFCCSGRSVNRMKVEFDDYCSYGERKEE